MKDIFKISFLIFVVVPFWFIISFIFILYGLFLKIFFWDKALNKLCNRLEKFKDSLNVKKEKMETNRKNKIRI